MNKSIQVIDDFLPTDIAESMFTHMMTMPMYSPNDMCVDKGEADGSILEYGRTLYPDKEKHQVLFQSIFYKKYFNNVTEYQSDFWKLDENVDAITKALNIKTLWYARGNCTPGQDKNYQSKYHTDIPDTKLASLTKTACVYLNSNNGGTLFDDEEKTFVQSKFNRAAVFPGTMWHSAVACTDAKLRFVLNLNYEEND